MAIQKLFKNEVVRQHFLQTYLVVKRDRLCHYGIFRVTLPLSNSKVKSLNFLLFNNSNSTYANNYYIWCFLN